MRNAQVRGLEVLMTIWGTPGWANGGKAASFLPKNMTDFKNFCRALAARYSGALPATRSSVSTGSGTSRTSATSSPRSSTRRARSSAPPTTPSSPLLATPASRPETARRSSRSGNVVARTRQAEEGSDQYGRTGHVHEGVAKRTRNSSSTPGRTTRTRTRCRCRRPRRCATRT